MEYVLKQKIYEIENLNLFYPVNDVELCRGATLTIAGDMKW